MAIRSIILALVLGILPNSVFAEWPYDSVGHTSNGKFGGSATLVGTTKDKTVGLVVSCAHIWDEGGQRGFFWWGGVEGKWEGKILIMDFERDLSLWAIKNPPNIKTPLCVTKAKPADGPFVAVGFPSYGNGRQHYNKGNFISYDRNGYEVYVNMDVHSGYSGGALFNKYGQYCGIVCGNTVLGRNGQPDNHGSWESRHTSGDYLISTVGKFMEVK